MQWLTTEKSKRYANYLKITGISLMVIYTSAGIYAFIVNDNDICSSLPYCLALKDFFSMDVFAEQTVEGVKYKVLLSDGIGTQDNLG